MENTMDWEHKPLINELTEGKALANQLRDNLNRSSSPETRQFLLEQILSSYEKALSMLNWSALVVETKPKNSDISESPHSLSNSSPKSEISGQHFKDPCPKDVFKKRKTQSKWTEQVRVCSGTGEGPRDDGYSWRKYGQKDILGANYPRGYYRCTHRHSQSCLATKQVQKSDEDPSIFEVTYKERHTCTQVSQSAVASTMHGESRKNKDNDKQQQRSQEIPNPSKDVFVVKTEDLDTREDIFPSFYIPYSAIGNEIEGNDIFTESMMENNFLSSLSPTFISSATSESNFFPISACHMNNFGMGYKVQTPESDLNDIISTPTSVTNSPIGDLDICNVDFESSFLFDDNP